FLNLTLQPEESATLTLRFDPAVPGTSFDTLLLNSDSDPDPVFQISLSGSAYASGPTARITDLQNNLGGAVPGGAPVLRPTALSITNDGAAALVISSIKLTQGAPAFSLVGIPGDLATHPITLQRGESFSFGASLVPDHLGLARGLIDIATNDP